jgi:hypothetical protein
MLDPKNLTPGTKYVIMITGVVRPVVAECTPDKDKYDWCILRVLNNGVMKDTRLKEGDYILQEVYDESKHGPVEDGQS